MTSRVGEGGGIPGLREGVGSVEASSCNLDGANSRNAIEQAGTFLGVKGRCPY